jgi:hypothetical protein
MRRFAKPVYGVNLYRGFESRPLRSKHGRLIADAWQAMAVSRFFLRNFEAA